MIDYFTRYRENWRNPSTHDYRIDFQEQEAFLALSTVSAFCFVAIDQMLLKLASDKASKFPELRTLNKEINDLSGLASLIALAIPSMFGALRQYDELVKYSEIYTAGYIMGYIKDYSRKIQIDREPILEADGRRLQPDLIALFNGSRVIIELKKAPNHRIKELVRGPRLREQLATYAHAGKASGAIGVVLPAEIEDIHVSEFSCTVAEDAPVPMIFVHPSNT